MLLLCLFMATQPARTYTYLARATPDYFDGRRYYVATFPDFPESFLEANSLHQLQEMGREVLAM